MSRWQCSICNAIHDEVPMDIAYARPEHYFEIPQAERDQRAWFNDDSNADVCVIDQRVFLVRCVLPVPVEGGKESPVLASVFWRGFCLVGDGIYFIPKPDTAGKSSIQFLSFPTGKVKMVAPISGSPTEGLSVSSDGRFLLFSQTETSPTLETDLMLVENFR